MKKDAIWLMNWELLGKKDILLASPENRDRPFILLMILTNILILILIVIVIVLLLL